MLFLVYTLHFLVCIFLILVVLLQQGKGADLSVFGGGSTQTAFGARGATTLLHKLTVASFVVFILTTLAIGIPQLSHGHTSVFREETGKAAKTPAASRQAPARPGAAAPVPAPPAGAAGKPATPAQRPAVPSPAPPAKPAAPGPR